MQIIQDLKYTFFTDELNSIQSHATKTQSEHIL